jgi:hypothetical protein
MLELATCWLIMFKGLISSKKISSADFTMVTGPGVTWDAPHDGKENKPDVTVVQQQSPPKIAAKPVTPKGVGKTSEKHRTLKIKERVKEVQGQPDEAVVMEDAFDRLLVSSLSIFFYIGNYVTLFSRMTFKFH